MDYSSDISGNVYYCILRCGGKALISPEMLADYIFPQGSKKINLDVTISYFYFFEEYFQRNYKEKVAFLYENTHIVDKIFFENEKSTNRSHNSEINLMDTYLGDVTAENIDRLPKSINTIKDSEIRIPYLILLCGYDKNNEETYLEEIKTYFNGRNKSLCRFLGYLYTVVEEFGWPNLLMRYIKEKEPEIYLDIEENKRKSEKLA